MAKVEIEESDLATFKRVYAAADAMLANPDTREQFLALQKKINPKAVIPEIDARDAVLAAVKGQLDPVLEEIKSLKTEREAEANRRAEENVRAQREQGLSYLREQGYQPDGIEKVEALMLAEGISSYKAGHALFERLNPPAQPADSSATRALQIADHAMAADDYKALWESQGRDEQWLQDSINAVRAEFRGGR